MDLIRLRSPFRGAHVRGLIRIHRRFAPLLRKRWASLFLAFLLLGATVAMEVLEPWPLKVVFDGLLRRPGDPVRPEAIRPLLDLEPATLLATAAISILALTALAGLFGYGYRLLLARVGREVVSAIRLDLYSHVQRLSRSFFDRRRSGDLLMRLTTDCGQLQDLLVSSSLDAIGKVLRIAGMIALMLFMDWRLALLGLSILLPLYATMFRHTRRLRTVVRKHRKREANLAAIAGEVLTSVALVQAFQREASEEAVFARENRQSLREGLKAVRLESAFKAKADLFMALGLAAVVWLGARSALEGRLSPGDLVVFTAYLQAIYKPVGKLSKVATRAAKATVAGERILAILEREPEIRDLPDAVPAPRFRGAIAFRDVTFAYAQGEPVLRGVDFDVRPGRTVALVGPSGAGKSTVFNLLLRLYDPGAGRIEIDGRDIRSYRLESLRGQLSVVCQEPLLLGRTVRENIAYGRPEATDEEVRAAAREAGADDFIERLPRGYETVLGERGATLSGGEKQRIAIARALMRDAPIVLLDEPMASLDAASEAKVREALARLQQGRTCIVIGHALERLADADEVLFLEKGSIEERGTHEELVAAGGRYGTFLELQARGRTGAAARPVGGGRPS